MYNDDLEEDNSDYVEEVEGEDDDSDIEDEEDEGTEKPAGEPQPAAGLSICFLNTQENVLNR